MVRRAEGRFRESKEFFERKAFTKECVNLAKLRATDIPNFKDIMMPNPAPIKDEIEIQQAKVESTKHSELKTPIARPLATGQIKNTVFMAKDKEDKGKLGKENPNKELTLNNQKARSANV